MKVSTQILIVLFLISSLFGCKKDGVSQGTTTNYFITAELDNKLVEAKGMVFATETTVEGVTFYNITGEDKDNDAYFTFYYKTKVAEDPTVDAESYGVSYPAEKVYFASKDVEGFSFVLTEETDTFIEGTFSFTAKELGGTDEIIVSEGMFKAKKI